MAIGPQKSLIQRLQEAGLYKPYGEGQATTYTGPQYPTPASEVRDGVNYASKVSTPSQSTKKKPALSDIAQDIGLREGVKGIGTEIGHQIAGGTPQVTGTDSSGNTTFSDGSVVDPSGSVVQQGSFASKGAEYGGYLAAAYQVYKALHGDGTTLQKGIGLAGAGNTAATAGGLLGAGLGAGVGAGLGAVSIFTGKGTPDQKGTAMAHNLEDAGLAYATGGVSGIVQTADRALLGGQLDKIRAKTDKFVPAAIATKEITSRALKMFGGKGGDQMQRDAMREQMKNNGLVTVDPNTGHYMLPVIGQDGKQAMFDIGNDGGFHYGDGRKAYELDPANGFEKDGKTPSLQGKMIAFSDPLTAIMSGGNQKLGSDFAGYLTNAGLQNVKDLGGAKQMYRDLYTRAGFKDAASAISGINKLVADGKLDKQRAAVNIASVNEVFGGPDPTKPQSTNNNNQVRQDTHANTPAKPKPKTKTPEKSKVPLSDLLPTLAPPPTYVDPDNAPTPEESDAVKRYRDALEAMAAKRIGQPT
jgi:hypothetical protein